MLKFARGCLVGLAVLAIIGAVASINFEKDKKHRQLLADRLAMAISEYENGAVSAVDFASFAQFEWGTLFVVAPYTPPARIDATLGGFWLGSRLTSIDSSDRIALLVFKKDDNVVQYLEYPRHLADFAAVVRESGYAREESRFIIEQDGDMIWVGGEEN